MSTWGAWIQVLGAAGTFTALLWGWMRAKRAVHRHSTSLDRAMELRSAHYRAMKVGDKELANRLAAEAEALSPTGPTALEFEFRDGFIVRQILRAALDGFKGPGLAGVLALLVSLTGAVISAVATLG